MELVSREEFKARSDELAAEAVQRVSILAESVIYDNDVLPGRIHRTVVGGYASLDGVKLFGWHREFE